MATAFGRHYPLPDIRLPISQRDVAKDLREKYQAKIAAGKEATAPTDADVKTPPDGSLPVGALPLLFRSSTPLPLLSL